MPAATSQAGVSAPEATVCALIEDIFGALGFTAPERAVLTETLLEASRAGYHSHGVMRIPTFAEDTQAGIIAPAVAPVVAHETAAAAMIDAKRCLGPVSAVFAVEQATAKARAEGIGCAAVCNGNDIARLGAYVGGPARAGLITLLLVNDAGGGACVAPFGSAAPFLSTNPLACGIPRADGALPLVIDLSTSVVALGKIRMAANLGRGRAGGLADRPRGPADDGARRLLRDAARGLPAAARRRRRRPQGFPSQPDRRGLGRRARRRRHEPGQRERGPGQRPLRARRRPRDAGQGRGVRAGDGGIHRRAGGPAAGRGQCRRAPPGARSPAAPGGAFPIDGPTWARIAAILESLSLGSDYAVTPAPGEDGQPS